MNFLVVLEFLYLIGSFCYHLLFTALIMFPYQVFFLIKSTQLYCIDALIVSDISALSNICKDKACNPPWEFMSLQFECLHACSLIYIGV